MEWVIHLLRQHSELAIFLTIAAGFWIGKMKIKQFSLGIVTSVLLVGVLVGQLNITIEEPVKSVFFLLFLFAIGYKVGPQFFRGLKKDGLPQVGFAALMCIGCLIITWLLAILMGYNAGEAAVPLGLEHLILNGPAVIVEPAPFPSVLPPVVFFPCGNLVCREFLDNLPGLYTPIGVLERAINGADDVHFCVIVVVARNLVVNRLTQIRAGSCKEKCERKDCNFYMACFHIRKHL